MKRSKTSMLVLVIGSAVLATACGKKNAATSVSTTASSATGGNVSIASKGYNAPLASNLLYNFFVPQAFASATAINSFKFCVTQLKLSGADGSEIKDESGSALLEARLGLVDLGDGSAPVTWGDAKVPAGAVVKKVAVEVHRDSEVCGVPYAASINGMEITKDLEFKFVFTDAKPLNAGDSLNLALTNLIAKFEQAVLAGQSDDEHIGHYMEGLEEDVAE